MIEDASSPGSADDNPHADQVNWRPATTIDDYVRNCREGLERYTDARAAKLLGVPAVTAWRWKAMSEIPGDLFERLLASRDVKASRKSLSQVAQALRGGVVREDVERCPHCGEALRVRARIPQPYRKIVDQWLSRDATTERAT